MPFKGMICSALLGDNSQDVVELPDRLMQDNFINCIWIRKTSVGAVFISSESWVLMMTGMKEIY